MCKSYALDLALVHLGQHHSKLDIPSNALSYSSSVMMLLQAMCCHLSQSSQVIARSSSSTGTLHLMHSSLCTPSASSRRRCDVETIWLHIKLACLIEPLGSFMTMPVSFPKVPWYFWYPAPFSIADTISRLWQGGVNSASVYTSVD